MTDIAQYISDLRETDALSKVIDEFLSVCVIPVESEQRASIMASVRIKALLPLDREIFVAGTVIMHRPDGFLVQLDCPPDLEFLRQTLQEATAAETGLRPPRTSSPARPPAPVPAGRPGTEHPAAGTAETATGPAITQTSVHEGGTTGRIQGNVNITERFDVPVTTPETRREKPAARDAASPHEAASAHKGDAPAAVKVKKGRPGARAETTASYFEKPQELAADRADAETSPHDTDDLSVSSFSAVDAVTGQPLRVDAARRRSEKTTPGFSVEQAASELDEEFSRRPTAASGIRATSQPQEVTRRFFSPDVLEKARAENLRNPAVSELVDGSATVDELFSLAAEAGAIDIAESGLLDIPPEPEKTSPSIQPPIDVTRLLQERTKPRFRRPAEVVGPPDQDNAEIDRDETGGTDGGEPAPEPENREMAVRIREMTSPEKQKLARQGKRVARRILVRDNDKTIHKYVLFNPEIQIDEVIEYTRWNGLSAEAIEFITTNRVWMESRDVIYNIVRNPSTPTEIAVRLVIKLTPNDWRMFARPGVVKPAVMNQARKLLLEAEKKS